MFDERAFIASVESASADDLARILAHPIAAEEKALRVHLGDERYQRLHGLALRRSVSRGATRPAGNVVVIHGIMGSQLTAIDRSGAGEQIWLRALRIAAGRLDRLRLGEDGRSEYDPGYDTRATGIMKRYYGDVLLSLSQRWNVRAFWFDWRKDIELAAAELEAQMSGWFGDTEPVHIVAHSMGGLVARTFIKNKPPRWKSMWDQPAGKRGGRLIMLGTPNHGAFVVPQVITGLEPLVRKIALLDLRHQVADLLAILNSFVGTYQMLPSPLVVKSMEPLYDAATYGDLNVPQHHLDNARKHHEALRDVVDPERMIYVAGYNQPTLSSIKDLENLRDADAYEWTLDGDGRVSHQLGLLSASDGRPVATYYVEEEHGNLPANAQVLAALDELLATGSTKTLNDKLPAARARPDKDARKREALSRRAREQADDEARMRDLTRRMHTRSVGKELVTYPTSEERQSEELVTRGFLPYQPEGRRAARVTVPFPPTSIEIGLVHAQIDDVDAPSVKGKPVDAIAVGHYIGVKPRAAELALDRGISLPLPGQVTRRGADLKEADLLLTQYSERGVIRGELGQSFFLADPRPAKGKGVQRVIAIAGMGLPGRFGVPELTVLVRELCWALGRMGKHHLASVLIGSGNGNLSIRDAVSGWLRGIKYAVTGSAEDDQRRLLRVTFVESDPLRLRRIQDAILDEQSRLMKERRLMVDCTKISEATLRKLETERLERDLRERAKRPDGDDAPADPIPTRVTLGLERGRYRYGAITETASVPEREVPLDPKLVEQANQELANESDRAMQLERGQFMERLLVPADLRAELYTEAPLVMLLDATTARIHWEMAARPDLSSAVGTKASATFDGGGQRFEFEEAFFGTSRGFTRQLRTTFAPPPEPPPPPRRLLRVLVVADPAADAHLPGAEEEGVMVADLFEEFNTAYEGGSDSRVEVVRLFGPSEATRTNVLRELMLRSYDVLHFAGHCFYNSEDPAASGWIFSAGERLSARELNRIDRIPAFVFSNACESGIMPDRSVVRSDLAPSFAEAFFARGVSNFVCTAWPVDDLAARQVALRLYAGLLGLSAEPDQNGRYRRTPPEPMHVAVRQARLAIASTPNGVRTWGAYQHYGNPFFQFFDPATLERRQPGGAKSGASKRQRRSRQRRSQ